MAFPRKFKREIWYVQLPSGEVEMLDAEGVQRAFECGLIDGRTPARAFGAHTWTTIEAAAELADATALGSFGPMTFDAGPTTGLSDVGVWKSNRAIDPKTFKKRNASLVGLVIAATATFVVGILGVHLPTNDLDAHIAAANAAELAAHAPSFVAPPDFSDMLHISSNRTEANLARAERHRLLEAEYVRRMNAIANASAKKRSAPF